MFTGQKIKRWGIIQLPFLIVFALIAVSLPLTSAIVNKKGEEQVVAPVLVERNEKDQRILGVHTTIPTSVPTKSVNYVTPTKSASTNSTNACVGEGGTVVSGLYCCSGLTKQNCSGSGSFVACQCKKSVTNPTPTPKLRACTTRTWVGGRCTERTYTRASNLACDPSTCAMNDITPTPEYRNCTTRSWSDNVCVSKTYYRASNLACDPSNCSQGEPTPALKKCVTNTWYNNICVPKIYYVAPNVVCEASNCAPNEPTPSEGHCIGEGGVVTSGMYCCSGLTSQNCSGSGSFVTCYCKKQSSNPTPTKSPTPTSATGTNWWNTNLWPCIGLINRSNACGCSRNSQCKSGYCDPSGSCTDRPVEYVVPTPTPVPGTSWWNTNLWSCIAFVNRNNACGCDKNSQCKSGYCDPYGSCTDRPEPTVAPKPTPNCVYGVDYNGDGIVNSMDMTKCLQDK